MTPQSEQRVIQCNITDLTWLGTLRMGEQKLFHIFILEKQGVAMQSLSWNGGLKLIIMDHSFNESTADTKFHFMSTHN